MDIDAPRPLLLLGINGDAVPLLTRAPGLRGCFVVSTPSDASVDDLAASLKPSAVLLDASEYYLEGSALDARLRARSRGSRVLFLDVEGPWALWMEVDPDEPGTLLIAPCEVEKVGESLMELLNVTGRAAAPVRLEQAG